jgi:hypothetical protein
MPENYNPNTEGNNPYSEEDLEQAAAEIVTRKLQVLKGDDQELVEPFSPKRNNIISATERDNIKAAFLTFLATGMSVSKAVAKINGTENYYASENNRISKKQFYIWRRMDKEFAKAWDEAYSVGTDALEDRAHDWAWEGNAALLQFLLRTRNPQRYAMNRHEISGPGGGAIPVEGITRTIIDPTVHEDDPIDVEYEVIENKATVK